MLRLHGRRAEYRTSARQRALHEFRLLQVRADREQKRKQVRLGGDRSERRRHGRPFRSFVKARGRHKRLWREARPERLDELVVRSLGEHGVGGGRREMRQDRLEESDEPGRDGAWQPGRLAGLVEAPGHNSTRHVEDILGDGHLGSGARLMRGAIRGH